MFKFLKNLLGFDKETMKEAGVQIEQAPYKVEPPVLVDKVAAVNAQLIEKTPRRAKNEKGRFIANNPDTPENEAWVGGVSPAKKPATKKAAPKKEPAKKPAGKGGRKPKAK